MNYKFALLLALLVFSTLSRAQKTDSTKKSTIKISSVVKKAVVDSLFNAYHKQYKKKLKIYHYNNKVRVDVKWENGARVLNILDSNNLTYASTTTVPNDIIEGDLNNDGLDDMLVIVYYNQGSRPRLDIYCYVTKNKKLRYHSKYTQQTLGFCTEDKDPTSRGRFFPAKIENGLLVGQTECLQAGDPGCCPSLEMISYFKFKNGLKLVRQERKPKVFDESSSKE